MPWGVARWTPSAHPQCWTGCQTYPAAEAGCKHKQLTFFFTPSPCDVRVCWWKKPKKQDNFTVKLSAVRNQSHIKIKIKYLFSQLSSHPFSAHSPNQTILHQPPAERSNPEFLQRDIWLAINCLSQLLLRLFSCLSLWPIHCVHPVQASLFFSTHTDTSYPDVKIKTFDQRSFSYCAPQQWNSLSSAITSPSMLPCFQYYVHILLCRLLFTL